MRKPSVKQCKDGENRIFFPVDYPLSLTDMASLITMSCCGDTSRIPATWSKMREALYNELQERGFQALEYGFGDTCLDSEAKLYGVHLEIFQAVARHLEEVFPGQKVEEIYY